MFLTNRPIIPSVILSASMLSVLYGFQHPQQNVCVGGVQSIAECFGSIVITWYVWNKNMFVCHGLGKVIKLGC